MKKVTTFPILKIIASDSQAVINLKLRYNALADKISEKENLDSELEGLHTQIKQLTKQTGSYT
ncbi:hypothetical protein GXP67_31540 [Rhodocytophaga rosea]|uniref:Uncharacterized protein n=1 Tax=Rhodocytophaga rosea TaxID=2704465 RepID=A0A6C0GU07_9BACT|nr:hypothetical protein [Rhodocytophaga rosea]QHT70860.1 hypothetical protein GXP67_31540 [Rhodocytophaga rosea]